MIVCAGHLLLLFVCASISCAFALCVLLLFFIVLPLVFYFPYFSFYLTLAMPRKEDHYSRDQLSVCAEGVAGRRHSNHRGQPLHQCNIALQQCNLKCNSKMQFEMQFKMQCHHSNHCGHPLHCTLLHCIAN